MTVTENFAAKLSVAFVAIAMAFSLVAPANAQESSADLQAEIDRLLEMISQLEGQMSGAGSSSDVCPYTWTRNLSSGSTGADVKALQQFLNADPDTQVAPAGSPGSPGMETDYYGPATGAAVEQFQMKYRSEVLSPLGLVNPTTFFGPSTRAQANELCVAPAPTPDEDEDEDEGEDEEEEEEEEEEFELGGNADLDTLELDDVADDEVEEGRADQPVAEVEVEFEDGDARVSRMEFELDLDSGQSGAEDEGWETFETLSLWMDGDMIAEIDVDDEDDWKGNDNTVVFSGLDMVFEEGDNVTLVLAATIQDGLDFASGNENDWTVSWPSDAIRFEDADGFVQEDGGSGTASFTIQEEGANDELEIRSSDADPNATTILLEDDSDTDAVAFAFDLDARDSNSDIEINEFEIVGEVASGTDLSTLIDDLAIIVDGDEISTEDVEVGEDLGGNVASNTIAVTFDSNDFIVEAGDRVTVEVEFEFKSLRTVDEGSRIYFEVDSSTFDAEGAADLVDGDTIDGSHTGETHTLITEGIVVNPDSVSVSERTQGQDDTTGIFEIEFEVTAEEDDFYITEDAAQASTSPVKGVAYTVSAPGVPTSVSGVLSSTADEDTNGVFTVEEGRTETFTLTVTVDASTTGQHRVTLDEVLYSASTNGTSNIQTRNLEPASDYRTGYENINQ